MGRIKWFRSKGWYVLLLNILGDVVRAIARRLINNKKQPKGGDSSRKRPVKREE